MRHMTAGLAAIVMIALAGPAGAQALPDGFQEDEQPGSEIEMGIGGGEVDARREDGEPLFGGIEIGGGNEEPPIDDPDTPLDGDDPIDEELPGEGPEDLSGPVGEDD